MPSSHIIAVEWTRQSFQAWLAAPDGSILREIRTEDGLRLVQREQFAMTFNTLCGSWLATLSDAQVVIVGAAGERRGWAQTPYLPCPADAVAMFGASARVRLASGQDAIVLPGLACEDADGTDAVTRGRECALLGAGIADGVVCMPGPISLWAELRGGSIARFVTYMTGEFEALLRGHAEFSRPAARDEDRTGFSLGLAAAAQGTEKRDVTGAQRAILPLGGLERTGAGGRSLLRLVQDVRASLALEHMNEGHLDACLAGLLIGDEVRDGLAAFGGPAQVHLIAEGRDAWRYGEALSERGIEVTTLAPSTCFVRGARAIAEAAAGQVPSISVERVETAPVPRFVFETPFGGI